jgi:hypothetical protein
MDDTVADTLKLADAFNLLHVSWSQGKIAQRNWKNCADRPPISKKKR